MADIPNPSRFEALFRHLQYRHTLSPNYRKITMHVMVELFAFFSDHAWWNIIDSNPADDSALWDDPSDLYDDAVGGTPYFPFFVIESESYWPGTTDKQTIMLQCGTYRSTSLVDPFTGISFPSLWGAFLGQYLPITDANNYWDRGTQRWTSDNGLVRTFYVGHTYASDSVESTYGIHPTALVVNADDLTVVFAYFGLPNENFDYRADGGGIYLGQFNSIHSYSDDPYPALCLIGSPTIYHNIENDGSLWTQPCQYGTAIRYYRSYGLKPTRWNPAREFNYTSLVHLDGLFETVGHSGSSEGLNQKHSNRSQDINSLAESPVHVFAGYGDDTTLYTKFTNKTAEYWGTLRFVKQISRFPLHTSGINYHLWTNPRGLLLNNRFGNSRIHFDGYTYYYSVA